MIQFQHVTKRYDNFPALDDVSFTIQPGEICGLLGHNGAGKSTAIKSLMTITDVSDGQILVNQQLVSRDNMAVKRQIGYVADTPDRFLSLKASEYFELIKLSYDIPETLFQERLNQFLLLFRLTGQENELIESFSHGMRQKVFVIGALLPNPKIWVLDEPMTGLDPQAAYDLKQLMRDHAAQGNTVLFSTHVLEVAQELCDHLIILQHGKVLYDGTTQDLQAQNKQASLESIYLSMTRDKQASDTTANQGDDSHV